MADYFGYAALLWPLQDGVFLASLGFSSLARRERAGSELEGVTATNKPLRR
jgi:hypothetical protein